MIDHVSIGTSDLQRAKNFYDACLKPLGCSCAYTVDRPGQGIVAHGYASAQKGAIQFWIGKPERCDTQSNSKGGTHIAFQAASRAEVDNFYAAALKAGGQDNGKPGLRPHYHPDYYGAFVIDPDGNKIEACCHNPE